MAITHIVLFKFKQDPEQPSVKGACARFLALKSECLHPTSQKPYVKSVSGGKNNSPEMNDYSHGFVVEFENEDDRDYYTHKDPAHMAFKKSLAGLIEKPAVVDFEAGVF